MNEWATEPFALRRDRIRRLVAQEFVWRLAAIGSGLWRDPDHPRDQELEARAGG